MVAHDEDGVTWLELGVCPFEIDSVSSAVDLLWHGHPRLQSIPLCQRLDLLDRLKGLRFFVLSGNAHDLGSHTDGGMTRRTGCISQCESQIRAGSNPGL